MKHRTALSMVCFLFGSAIALGALGAHTLKEILTESKLASFETAVRYQLYGAIGLAIMALLGMVRKEWNHRWSQYLLAIGTLFFSGSIYVLVFATQPGIRQVFGPITPIGGVLMIVAWLLLFIHIQYTKCHKDTYSN